MAPARPTASIAGPSALRCLDGSATFAGAADGRTLPPGDRSAMARGRAREMAALRERGLSLDEVGLCFGVSRERVRQILRVHGGPARHAVISARRRRADQQLAAHVDELLGLWRGGAQLSHAAAAFGLPVAACREAIMRIATDGDRAARRGNLARTRVVVNTYTDGDIIVALRSLASDLQRVPSAKDYAPLGREPGYPSLATVINRMDGWSNAVCRAGLSDATTAAAVSTRSRRWTVDACWAAVRRVVGELGTIPTIAHYDRHATGRAGLPSSATLRNRLGRWSSITTQLAIERETAQAARPAVAARRLHSVAPSAAMIDRSPSAAPAAQAPLSRSAR